MIDINKTEKQDIFSCSFFVGISLIILCFVQVVLSFIIVFFLAVKGFPLEQISGILNNTWSGYLINTISSVLCMTLPFLLLKTVAKQPIYKICKFNSPKKGLSLYCVGFVVGVAMLANVFTNYFNSFIKYYFGFEATQSSIGDNYYADPFELIFTILAVAVIPALVEEFAFRGMILGALRKFGDIPAILVSAILFALLHGNFIQIPFALIIGIALGFIVVISDSIWPAIIAHFINNAFSVLVNALPENDKSVNLALLLMFLLFVLGILSFIILKRKNAFAGLNKTPSTLSSGSRFFRMLLSPTTAMFIAFMIYTAFTNRI